MVFQVLFLLYFFVFPHQQNVTCHLHLHGNRLKGLKAPNQCGYPPTVAHAPTPADVKAKMKIVLCLPNSALSVPNAPHLDHLLVQIYQNQLEALFLLPPYRRSIHKAVSGAS